MAIYLRRAPLKELGIFIGPSTFLHIFKMADHDSPLLTANERYGLSIVFVLAAPNLPPPWGVFHKLNIEHTPWNAAHPPWLSFEEPLKPTLKNGKKGSLAIGNASRECSLTSLNLNFKGMELFSKLLGF